MREDFDRNWEKLGREAMDAIKQWRLEHPKATLSEIEQAFDAQLGNLRARMIEDLALASTSADLSSEAPSASPLCQSCGSRLESRGKKKRRLKTHQGQTLELDRSYAVCPTCEVGFFPPR